MNDLICKKCNTNLENFIRFGDNIFHCRCEPIADVYTKCSGIFIEFNSNYFYIQLCNYEYYLKEDLFYRYEHDGHNRIIISDCYYINEENIISFNYYINLENKLDSIKELYIAGNKFKENLLFT